MALHAWMFKLPVTYVAYEKPDWNAVDENALVYCCTVVMAVCSSSAEIWICPVLT